MTLPQISKDAAKNDPLFISSLVSAFQVLELFAGPHRELSMKQIREETGLTFQTIQRITNTLEHCGYLQRDERTRGFRLTLKTLDMQYRFVSTDRLVKVAWPVLVGLREQTRLRVSLCALDGSDIIYLLRVAGFSTDVETSLIGRRRPAYCSAGGRVILSYLPPAEREAVLAATQITAVTPQTLTDPQQIRARIADCEAQRYAIVEEESQLGEIDIAVPVIGPRDNVLGALVVSAAMQRLSADQARDEILPLMRDAARAITST